MIKARRGREGELVVVVARGKCRARIRYVWAHQVYGTAAGLGKRTLGAGDLAQLARRLPRDVLAQLIDESPAPFRRALLRAAEEGLLEPAAEAELREGRLVVIVPGAAAEFRVKSVAIGYLRTSPECQGAISKLFEELGVEVKWRRTGCARLGMRHLRALARTSPEALREIEEWISRRP